MVAQTKSSKSQADVDPLLQSTLVNFAERQAVMAGECLRAMEANSMRRGELSVIHQNIPAGFLLELGAVMQLKVWELNGLHKLLPPCVPTYDDAVVELCKRVQQDPLQFRKLASAILSKQLLNVWLERCSWSAPALLGVDILVGEADDDVLIEAVAQLLWKHRDDLRRCPEKQ